MDHFRLGLAAFEARQFVEADFHLNGASANIASDDLQSFFHLRYRCAKILRPASCWREFSAYCRCLAKHSQWDQLLSEIANEESLLSAGHLGFVHELRAQAYFSKGALFEARQHAIKHVEYLQHKKLSAQLAQFAHIYQTWNRRSLYFLFAKLQAATLVDDVAAAQEHFMELMKGVTRRWSKMDDKKEGSKASLLEAALECIKLMETSDARAVLLGHQALLYLRLVQQTRLAKDEWKKLVELIVDEDSWSHLKLALELAIQNDAQEMALETYAALKRKKGFSFVKLTKYDPALKQWLLTHANQKTVTGTPEPASVTLTAEDLQLTEAPLKRSWQFSPEDPLEDEETRAIELNAINQLRLHDPPLELWPDLLVAYQTMRFHRVVNWLLEQSLLKTLPAELNKKISYFRLIHTIEQGDHHLALALLQEMLGATGNTLEEFKELMYAQGTVYLRLGQLAAAKKSLREVAKLDPEYRQLRERMASLE